MNSFIQSQNHPDLANRGPARTMSASQACVKRRLLALNDSSAEFTGDEDCEEGVEEEMEENPRQANKTIKRRRSQRLSCFEVSNIIVEINIQNRTKLLAFAREQKAT